MVPAMGALLMRVYADAPYNIDTEVDTIFPTGTKPTQNSTAKAELNKLAVDVRAKRSDDGLRRSYGVLDPLA